MKNTKYNECDVFDLLEKIGKQWVLLIIYHGYCFKLVNDFKNDFNTKSGKFYRLFNELPVLTLLAIVILVYIKPF